jgi:excisionase family DNA binding protein
MPENREYLMPIEVARRLHVSTKTVHRWTEEGKIPAMRTLGGHRRYSVAVVDALVEKMQPRVTA